ncbi:MAG: universal stress protein [Burkholderiales bacterium]|nr:universal stress protein [Burkholderiales bacterium]
MQRYALSPLGPTPEQVLVAIPGRARDWTIAPRNRGLHRLLVPVDSSLRALDALRYIIEELGDYVAGAHVVNVQSPAPTRGITPLVGVETIAALREAAGERIIAVAREAFAGSGIPVTGEVAFGAPAETICRIAEQRRCTGIVIGRNGFELHHLIRGSVAAKVLQLATVPVTIVNTRTAAAARRAVAGARQTPARQAACA